MQSLQKFMLPLYKNISPSLKDISVMKNKTILITGASGLIGANIVAYLDYINETENLNINVIAITRSGQPKWLRTSAMVHYIKMDLSTDVKKLVIPFDFLIHAATYAQPKKVLENINETVTLNTETLLHLLISAKKYNAQVLFISSSEIYGDATKNNRVMSETDYGSVNTLSQRALYAESKRLAEAICFAFKEDVQVKIARTLIAYGPGVKYDDKRVIPEFIKKAQQTKSIQMLDKGTAIRTFCFITDTVEMLLNIVCSGKDFVYNVSGKNETTIAELAEKVAKINHAKITFPKVTSTISGTPLTSVISNQKYCNEFNKTHFVSLEEGIKITSDWLTNIDNEK